MKQLQEIDEEIRTNETLAASFTEAVKENRLGDFFREHGCDAAPEEVKQFLAQMTATMTISDDELAHIAGGVSRTTDPENERPFCGGRM